MRSLTPVEAAAGVAVIGSLVAAALPTFVGNLRASRLTEPMDGLNRIAARATALSAGRAAAVAYPPSVDLTPHDVPQGRAVQDAPGTWEHPSWRLLDFSITVPHHFSFGFTSQDAAAEAHFRAFAHGDLDGDGVLSTFSIRGTARDGADPTLEPMELTREVE